MVREQLLNAVGQLQLLRIRQGQQLAGLLLQQLAADHKVVTMACGIPPLHWTSEAAELVPAQLSIVWQMMQQQKLARMPL